MLCRHEEYRYYGCIDDLAPIKSRCNSSQNSLEDMRIVGDAELVGDG